MPLLPDEMHLQGRWIEREGRVVGDATCKRIEQLTASELERLATDWSGWDTLYRDPRDDRLWEHTFPESAMHGGGPPVLTAVPFEYAVTKYDLLGGPSGLIASRRDLEGALATYVAVLVAASEQSNRAEDRRTYDQHLAAAARMFAALRHEHSLGRLREIVAAERRAFGSGYLSGEEGAKAEGAFEEFASKLESLNPSG
jgi:hypothetical protein